MVKPLRAVASTLLLSSIGFIERKSNRSHKSNATGRNQLYRHAHVMTKKYMEERECSLPTRHSSLINHSNDGQEDYSFLKKVIK